MVQMYDRVPVSGLRRTRFGYAVAEVKAGRTGIQLYRGDEVGMPDKEIVRVYRPPEEVFDDETMRSFAHLPVTNGHPREMVDSKNWKKYGRGYTGDTVKQKDKFVQVPLILLDEDTIDDVEKKSRNELSWGYTCDLDTTSGVTPEGEQYDAIQRNIRGNHLAVVSAGRAGSECRIGDEADDNHGGHTMAEKTVMVDGLMVVTTDQGAAAIDKLVTERNALKVDNAKLQTDHATALADKDREIATLKQQVADKDKELGTKTGEIERLKAEALDESKIDQIASERAEVIGKAKTIAKDADFKGKSIKDIRRVAVAKARGEQVVKDRSDDFVEALFLELTKDADTGRDPIRETLRDGTTRIESNDEAHRGMCNYLENAWQGPQNNGQRAN